VVLPWPQPAPRYSPLALWHLLSLDAPTVAALWTMFIAACAGVTLRWTQPAAMFIAVWMIYAADRLLDARLLDACVLDAPSASATPSGRSLARGQEQAPCEGLEARHRFHHRFRNRFLAMIVAASAALVLLLPRIGAHTLHLYALLATLLAAWLLLIHAGPLPSPALRRLPKELAVGIFFPAAVFIPTVARAPGLRVALLPAAALFAAVCTLNCLFLYAWEHPDEDQRTREVQSPQPQAHWTTRWAMVHLTTLAGLVAALAFLLACTGAAYAPLLHLLPFGSSANLAFKTGAVSGALLRGPEIACALAAALLLMLHRLRRRFSAVHLRALADLVLLTPLLVLPLLRPVLPLLRLLAR
jgi:hypothetical protein